MYCEHCESEVDLGFLHSRCCGAHWELIRKDGKFYLACEKCGRPAHEREALVISPGRPFLLRERG